MPTDPVFDGSDDKMEESPTHGFRKPRSFGMAKTLLQIIM